MKTYDVKPGTAKRGFRLNLEHEGRSVGQIWLAESEKAEADALLAQGQLLVGETKLEAVA